PRVPTRPQPSSPAWYKRRQEAPMILFQLHFEVADDRAAEFEKTYKEVFEPALRKQKGFQNVRFIRFYSKAQASEIEASPTEHNYQVNFVFDSEQSPPVW